jgi:protease PrsW
MEYWRIPLYILFGILPSLAWLFYYLRKDLHPEPKRMIVKIFLYGCLATIPVYLIQVALSTLLTSLHNVAIFSQFPILPEIIYWLFIIALTEETIKYLVVRTTIFGSYVLDEPLDVMLYMVVVALGFAAVENALYLFSPLNNVSFDAVIKTTIIITIVRFLGATFLHTLCSATIGYFVAKGFFDTKHRVWLAGAGISLAVLLHACYDFSIITLVSPFNLVVPIIIIVGLATFVISAFTSIKKLKSVSLLQNNQ